MFFDGKKHFEKIQLTWDLKDDTIIYQRIRLPCKNDHGFCDPTIRTQATIVWYPEDTCTTFQVAKIHERMIKFHQKYFVESIPHENVKSAKITHSNYKFRNIRNIEKNWHVSILTRKQNLHVNTTNHFIKHNIQKFLIWTSFRHEYRKSRKKFTCNPSYNKRRKLIHPNKPPQKTQETMVEKSNPKTKILHAYKNYRSWTTPILAPFIMTYT